MTTVSTSARPRLVELYVAELARRVPPAVPVVAADLEEFFTAVERDPLDVTPVDVLGYATASRIGKVRNVFRFYAFLLEQPDVPLSANPVPEMLADRRSRRRSRTLGPEEPAAPAKTGLEAIGPRPKALLEAAATARDRAILAAMLFGAMRAGEVVALRLGDLHPQEGWVLTSGTRRSPRIVPLAPAFFAALDAYLAHERPDGLATDLVFVGLKGRHRGQPLSSDAVQDRIARVCTRVGIPPVSAGDLRLACLAALRAAGMGVESLRVLAGHSDSSRPTAVPDGGWVDDYRRAASFLELE